MILEEKGKSSSGTDNLLDRDMNTVEDTTEKFIRPYHAQESAKKTASELDSEQLF